MSGLLSPERRETMLGNAEILEIFDISKVGKIAGCRVTDGVVQRGANVRLIRDNVVVHEGKLSTLKRFKDEVREVPAGQECGMAFEKYEDMRAGDVIECYRVEEIARTSRTARRRTGPNPVGPRSREQTMKRTRVRAPAGAASQRQLRVGEVIRHALAEILQRGEVHDPAFEGSRRHGAGSPHGRRT